jgi:hypothetical protein
MGNTIVECDGCGRDTSVLTTALEHPFCVLVLCEDCAFAPADTEPYFQDVSHHVVGKRVG